MQPAIDRLVSVPENPVPEGARVTVAGTADGVGLRIALWRPETARRGAVCVLPGRSEFIEKYFETITDLLRRGFAVASLDWRGQGGSQRLLSNPIKGHIDHFALYRRDLDTLLGVVERQDFPRPWCALAHSMGGAVLIDTLAHGEARIERGVLSAPMCGIHNVSRRGAASAAVRVLNLAGLGGFFLPGGRAHAPSAFDPFEDNQLTSDPARYQRTATSLIAGPDLAIGGPTIGWTAAAFRLIKAMRRPDYGLAMRCPLLFVTAGNETIVSSPAAEALASRIRGASALHIPGSRHEILMERDVFRDQFWAAFDAYIPG